MGVMLGFWLGDKGDLFCVLHVCLISGNGAWVLFKCLIRWSNYGDLLGCQLSGSGAGLFYLGVV